MVNYNPFPDLFSTGNHVPDRLRIISKALKDYLAHGKTTKEFEEEYGCDIVMDKSCVGIKDVKFHNDSNETMFMLKYNK